jgi:hypothetical protein
MMTFPLPSTSGVSGHPVSEPGFCNITIFSAHNHFIIPDEVLPYDIHQSPGTFMTSRYSAKRYQDSMKLDILMIAPSDLNTIIPDICIILEYIG